MDGRVIISVEHMENTKRHTMATDTSDSAGVAFEEIATKMGSPRRSILALLNGEDEGGGQNLNSQQIRHATGVSSGSIRHHLKRLENEWGLVEEVDREETGAGGAPARVFALTDRGRRYLGSDPAEDESAIGTLDGTAERVNEMETRLNRMEDEVAEINQKLDALAPVAEKIMNQLD